MDRTEYYSYYVFFLSPGCSGPLQSLNWLPLQFSEALALVYNDSTTSVPVCKSFT